MDELAKILLTAVRDALKKEYEERIKNHSPEVKEFIKKVNDFLFELPKKEYTKEELVSIFAVLAAGQKTLEDGVKSGFIKAKKEEN